MRKLIPLVAVGLVVCLTACAGPTLSDFADTRALVDSREGKLSLPLDNYALSTQQQRVVEHANALRVEQCMEDLGRPYPRATENWEGAAVPPDRRFGLWVYEDAVSNGYDTTLDERTEEIDALEQTYPDDWWEAAFGCLDSVEQLPLMGTELNAEQISVAARGVLESFDSGSGDPEWEVARQEWSECLRDAGLAPSDETSLNPKLPDDPEDRSRIALIDVECKETNATVQKLADIQARYQALYVASHEDELNAYKTEGLEVLREAESIIAEYG